jgi:hypothetical protein
LAAGKKLGFSTVEGFKKWLDTEIPYFTAVQTITNGTKHFIRKEFARTEFGNNYVEPGYAEKGYFKETCLLLEVHHEGRLVWKDFDTVLEQLLLFWRNFIIAYGPYEDLPFPERRLSEPGKEMPK